MSRSTTVPSYPVSRELRTFIHRLQRRAARYYLRCPAITIDAAAEGAAHLGQSLEDAIKDGTLIEMEDNVIVREMQAGVVPEEFG